MDYEYNKFYEIEIKHKLNEYNSNFKKEKYFESYLNLKAQGTAVFLEFYERNTPIVNSNYTGILKKQNLNYESFSRSNEKYFSNKIESDINLFEKHIEILPNFDCNHFYSEIENSLEESINYLSTELNSRETAPKFYCKICDNNYSSEKNHFAEVQRDYKIYLETGFQADKPADESHNVFDYFKPYLPEKVYNFKPFELKLTPFYQILKSDLLRKYTVIIFENLHEIFEAHSLHNNEALSFNNYNNPDFHFNNYHLANSDTNSSNQSALHIENPYALINLNTANNLSNNLVTQSNLTFEIINYYTIQDNSIANLTTKLGIILTLKKAKEKKNPDEDKEVLLLSGFLGTHFGESDTYIGGMLKSKKKELEKRLSTGSLLPIFNFSKLSEADKKLIQTLFPDSGYPHYKIKEIKPNIPDSKVTHCGICQTKFGLFFTRKHHCRVCGSIFCDNCLIWSRVPFLGYMSRVRVCTQCQVAVKRELTETILEDLVDTINDIYQADPDKKVKKKKIYVLIGLLKKLENFSKWGFLGYELINKLMCGLAVVCFKYEQIEFEEWFNLAVLFCKKGLYKKAFKCLSQVKYVEFKNLKNSEKKNLLFDKSEFYKFKAKENFEIFGILWLFSFYLYLAMEENDEIVILSNLMHKAFQLEQEQFYFLSKLVIYFIRDQYLADSNPDKSKNEILAFEYAVEFMEKRKNDYFFLNFFAILNLPLDSWLNLLLKFLEFGSFSLIKADIVYKCILYFYPNTNLNFVDSKKYKKILFYNLTKIDFHIYNPDYWLESFFLNPEINDKGDNMILILFLRLYCNSYNLNDLSQKYFAEGKYEYAFLCNMIISISENNKNYFLQLTENFYASKNYGNAMVCLYLSGKSFKEAGDLYAQKKLYDLSLSCYYQQGYEKAVESALKLLNDLSFEDFLLCNYAILRKELDEKVKIILLTNLILALKDNEKLNNADYIKLLCYSIKNFSNYLDNNFLASLHLLLCEVLIKENFEIAIGALHSVPFKSLDEYFRKKFEQVLLEFNSEYARIIYQKLAEGYAKNESLVYFVNVMKQLNSSRLAEAHKFYNAIKSNKLVDAGVKSELGNEEKLESVAQFDEQKKFILLKLLRSYMEKYLDNYKNSLKDLFEVFIEFPDQKVYEVLTDVIKNENYFATNLINVLINQLRLSKENLKVIKNKKSNNINNNNNPYKHISNIPPYANLIDISFPNYAKENRKELISKNQINQKPLRKEEKHNSVFLRKPTLDDLINEYIPQENQASNNLDFEEQLNLFDFKQTAFDYLDLTTYLENDLDKAQSFLLSIVFFLKESKRIQILNYVNALKRIVIQLIFNVYYLVNNYATGIQQLYFFKILFVVILELISDPNFNHLKKQR